MSDELSLEEKFERHPEFLFAYRLGVRLREIELLIQCAGNYDEMAPVLSWLRSSSTDLKNVAAHLHPSWASREAETLLRQAHHLLADKHYWDEELDSNTDSLYRRTRRAAEIIQDSLRSPFDDWFELGVLSVPEPSPPEWVPPAVNGLQPLPPASPSAPDPAGDPWAVTWTDEDRLNVLLERTGTSREELLAKPSNDSEADNYDGEGFDGLIERHRDMGDFPEALWPIHLVEHALQRYPEKAPEARRRSDRPAAEGPLEPASPQTLRNLSFLRWKTEKGAETFESNAKVRDKWNAENPDRFIGEGGRGIGNVKQGIKSARSFLDKHKIDLETAIERIQLHYDESP